MGLLSSSKSRTNVTTQTDTSNTNQADIGGHAFSGIGGSVMLSDQGSIDFAAGAFSETVDAFRDVLGASQSNNEIVRDLAGAVVASESKNDAPRIEGIANKAVLGSVLIVAIFLFKDKF